MALCHGETAAEAAAVNAADLRNSLRFITPPSFIGESNDLCIK
jgi:hypothetical protein